MDDLLLELADVVGQLDALEESVLEWSDEFSARSKCAENGQQIS